MRRELIVAAGPGEWRAALLEEGVAVELRVERGDGAEAGSIHLGRVVRLLPALGAALVDIGGDRPGFLPQSEILPRGRRLDEGERIIAQVRREAQGGKAARLTTAVTLRGRSVELVAGRLGVIGVDALPFEMRARLLEILVTLTHPASSHPLPRGRGRERVKADPRTTIPEETSDRLADAAVGLRLIGPAPSEVVVEEATGLVSSWQHITERAARGDLPARLYPASTFAAALAAALPIPDAVIVDDPGAIPELRAALPKAEIAHEPESRWAVDLDTLFDEVLSPTLALPGAGSVHFEATRAATMIDVDSGTPETGSPETSALTVDLAAAGLIARQLRLRNIGGGIVIDFVGLDDRRARERVHAALARGLSADPAKPQLLGWTRLGHLELVRPRRAGPLAEALLKPASGGPWVKSARTIAFEALRAVRREDRAQPGRRWQLIVAPEVAAALAGGAAEARRGLEQRLGREIAIAADPRRDRTHFQIAPG